MRAGGTHRRYRQACHPAQRDRRRNGGQGLPIAVMSGGLVGVHEPGGDTVNPHGGRPLDRQSLGQHDQARLGGGISGRTRRRAKRRDAADVEDQPALSLFPHDRVGGLRDEERREQVQPDDGGHQIRRCGRGRYRRRPACIVHRYVQSPEPADGLGHHLSGLGGVADIGGGELNAGRQRLRLGSPAGKHPHTGTG